MYRDDGYEVTERQARRTREKIPIIPACFP